MRRVFVWSGVDKASGLPGAGRAELAEFYTNLNPLESGWSWCDPSSSLLHLLACSHLKAFRLPLRFLRDPTPPRARCGRPDAVSFPRRISAISGCQETSPAWREWGRFLN